MKDRSDDPSHHERTLLPRSYISLLSPSITHDFVNLHSRKLSAVTYNPRRCFVVVVVVGFLFFCGFFCFLVGCGGCCWGGGVVGVSCLLVFVFVCLLWGCFLLLLLLFVYLFILFVSFSYVAALNTSQQI